MLGVAKGISRITFFLGLICLFLNFGSYQCQFLVPQGSLGVPWVP